MPEAGVGTGHRPAPGIGRARCGKWARGVLHVQGFVEGNSRVFRLTLRGAWRMLDELPSDVLLHVLTFADVPELTALCSTSKGLAKLAGDDDLWRDAYLRDFGEPSGPAAQVQERYMARLGAIRERAQHMRERWGRRQAALLHTSRKESISRCTFAFSTAGVLVLPFPLIMVALGVVARSADSSRPAGPSLWGWLWALWLCVGYLLAAGAWICFLRAVRARRSPLLREQYEHHAGPFRGVIKNVLADRPRAIAHCGSMFALALLAPVLLAVPASGAAAMPWSVAFIPLWLVFTLFLCAPCCGWRLRDEPGAFVAILGVVWLPLLVTLILLAVRLDGTYIALAWVFLPIWIFGCCTCAGATGGSVFGVIRARRENLRGEYYAFGLSYLAFVVLFCPPVVTLILLSVRDAGASDVTWAGAFLPSLVSMGVLAVAGTVLGFSVCRKRFHQRRFQLSDADLERLYPV